MAINTFPNLLSTNLVESKFLYYKAVNIPGIHRNCEQS